MKSNYIVSTLLASFLLTGIVSFQATAAEEYVVKAQKQLLHKAPLAGAEGKEMTVVHFAFPPGFVSAKHIHPGPVFVYVLEGEFTVDVDGVTQTIKAGELYPEKLNAAMVAKNLSSTDNLEVLVFQVGTIGKPMMLKAD
ncbi:MAG: quercetin dioxygenase-like cupin family protein [Polaribacter sp.]|jgi:quercetin dioxygenase-like cupin family protein